MIEQVQKALNRVKAFSTKYPSVELTTLTIYYRPTSLEMATAKITVERHATTLEEMKDGVLRFSALLGRGHSKYYESIGSLPSFCYSWEVDNLIVELWFFRAQGCTVTGGGEKLLEVQEVTTPHVLDPRCRSILDELAELVYVLEEEH